jgi:uncharacterized damage-inducible protein DinB
MVQKLEWFKREFVFDLEAWMFANIVERLRGTPARCAELTSRFEEARLTMRPEGKWSIQENIGHLLDLEPLWFARAEDILQGKTELRPADLTNRKTHEANHNARSFAAILGEFRSARTDLIAILENVGERDILRSALHPRLKQPMRLLDLAFFVAEHDDHHLAAASETGYRI